MESALLNERITRLEQLLDISRHLNATLDMRALLVRIVQAARSLTDADGASILLVETENTLRFAAFCGPQTTTLKSVVVPVEKSLAGWVLREREPAVVEDAETDPRMCVIEPDSEIRSIVAVPMHFGDECIGVLESLTHEKPHHFTPQDVETLTILAGNAAVAVQNVRLFQQSDWITEIVHEIRTPLTAIMSYTDLLNHPQIDAETKAGFIEVIQRETERVHTLVNQFLELARLESGRMTFSRTPFTLDEPILNAAQTIRARAKKRGMEISIDLPDTLPEVVGDAGRIEQVLLNLLSNAVKYAAPNTTIKVRSFRNEETVHVSVTDRGPGISPEHLSRLFQKFSRLPGNEEQATGSGLGLHISRQIIEAHGGELWAESEPGVGSTFTFTLPL